MMDSVYFEKLRLQNYGIFRGSTEFLFDRKRTFIMGFPGAGKTTISNALSSLGPAPGVKLNVRSETSKMSATVSLNGNEELIREYSKLVFVDNHYASSGPTEDYLRAVANFDEDTIEREVRPIFEALVGLKPWKIDQHRDLKKFRMAMGERACLNYSYNFAARKLLGLELPVVFNWRFGLNDDALHIGVNEFLRQQDCQQIFLLGKHQYVIVRKEEGAHYILDRPKINGIQL